MTSARSYGGAHERADFATVMVDDTGLNLLDWARQNLEAGQEVAIGFPFAGRAPGDGVLQGSSSRLHRADDGTVWLHSFKHNRSFFHEAGTAADDHLPGVEMLGSTAPRSPSAGLDVDHVLGLDPVDPAALAAEAARERAEEVRDTAHRARRRATMAGVMAPYEERVAKRRAAATALDPAAVTHAQRVVRAAKELHPEMRAALYARGWTPPTEPCGFTQLLACARTGRRLHVRRSCGGLGCGRCAPRRMALKVTAICDHPPTRGKGDATVFDLPLAARGAVYLYELGEEVWESWVRRWRREANVRLAAQRERPEAASRTFGDDPPVFVTFRRGGEVRVLTDVLLPRSRKSHDGAPTRGIAPGDLRARVQRLVTEAYRLIQRIPVEDVDAPGTYLPGTTEPWADGDITSSEGLCLDPEVILRVAVDHEWVFEGTPTTTISETAAAFAEEVGVEASDQGTETPSVLSRPVTDVDALDRLHDRLGVPRLPRPAGVDVAADPDSGALDESTPAPAPAPRYTTLGEIFAAHRRGEITEAEAVAACRLVADAAA